MKLAAGFAVFCTASTQGFATAGELTSAPNLAFIKLPGFQGSEPHQPSAFDFRNVKLPSDFLFQGSTSIPMEWWQQGSNSPLAIVIGNAEGTRGLDGSMNPAYYWHQDPGNGANNFGSFSFQHLSHQETSGVLSKANSDDKRWAAAQKALPEVADQRQLVKLRRFHDLLQAQAKNYGIQLTNLELINGLDLTTQSELAGLDGWGYVDRLAQMKKTISDPDEQIIRARTWSYWDPVENRWAAPGLGNTEYYIRRDQARRFNAVKQALIYQQQQPSLLQDIDLAWAAQAEDQSDSQNDSLDADENWAIAILNQQTSLEGSSFNRQPLQLTAAQSDLDGLLAETFAAEVVLADSIAQNATVAVAQPTDISVDDINFKYELSRIKDEIAPQLSEEEAVEVAQNINRPLELTAPDTEAWDRLAMTAEEFALATAIASPSVSDTDDASDETIAFASSPASEDEAITRVLSASVTAAPVETNASLVPQSPSAETVSPEVKGVKATQETPPAQTSDLEIDASPLPQAAIPQPSEQLNSTSDFAAADEEIKEEITGNINASFLMMQSFIPEELKALPLEVAPLELPKEAAVKPGQPLKQSPTKIVQAAAIAHVQAAEPLIHDRLESQEFLTLATGLKGSPIDVPEEVIGLAPASEPPEVSQTIIAIEPSLEDLANEPSQDINVTLPPSANFSAPGASTNQIPAELWRPELQPVEITSPSVEPIIPPDVQTLLDPQQPKQVERPQAIADTILFFEENISQ